MNSEISETELSAIKDKQIGAFKQDFLSPDANTSQEQKTTITQTQNDKPFEPFFADNQQHKTQQWTTDDLHFDRHLLYTMIARFNAAFAQLIADIQRHQQTKSSTPQTVHPLRLSQLQKHQTFKHKHRRHQTPICYRCRLRGHLAADCNIPFVRKYYQSSRNIGDKPSKHNIKRYWQQSITPQHQISPSTIETH